MSELNGNEVLNVELPNGDYKGYWSGYEIEIEGNKYETVSGNRSFKPMEVDVQVIENVGYIEN